MVGDMLLSIRLPGAIELAWPGCGSNMYMLALAPIPALLLQRGITFTCAWIANA